MIGVPDRAPPNRYADCRGKKIHINVYGFGVVLHQSYVMVLRTE